MERNVFVAKGNQAEGKGEVKGGKGSSNESEHHTAKIAVHAIDLRARAMQFNLPDVTDAGWLNSRRMKFLLYPLAFLPLASFLCLLFLLLAPGYTQLTQTETLFHIQDVLAYGTRRLSIFKKGESGLLKENLNQAGPTRRDKEKERQRETFYHRRVIIGGTVSKHKPIEDTRHFSPSSWGVITFLRVYSSPDLPNN